MSIEATEQLVRTYGIGARPLREAIALLATRPCDLEELVLESRLPRRTAEELLGAIGQDLLQDGDVYRLRDSAAPAYGERFTAPTRPPDPLGERLREAAPLVQRLARRIAAAPTSRIGLDHVPATPETVVRRALWLDATYDLTNARVLFLGDHDLTSLALAELRPDVETAVVDVDDATLAHLEGGPRCVYGDLRLGLPPALAGWADLVFTDPPYTPEGVRLFCARGVQALRDREQGRLVVAYGFTPRQPALGLRVQQAMQGLHLVFEAILPGFNRYQGAQAVASASDLYVCRPTSRTWKAAERLAGPGAIYTRGSQARESASPALAQLATLIERPGPVAALDLIGDPGGWLLRALLALSAERPELLTRNVHPDLADQRGQQALASLLAPKYRLRFRRSHPKSDLAVVEAELVDRETLEPPARLVRRLLDNAHGKIANIWREGLIEVRGDLTKNQSRAVIAAACDDPALLDLRLLDVPRHRLASLLEVVAASYVTGSTS